MANARGVNKKHATKQIDRLLSNPGFDIWKLSSVWAPYVIGEQKEIIVALDWTSFAGDEQHQLSLNILTSKGSSTPLLWKSVDKSRLKNNRARYEDQLLNRFKEVLPVGVKVTLVADRGFAAQKFFAFINDDDCAANSLGILAILGSKILLVLTRQPFDAGTRPRQQLNALGALSQFLA